MEYFFCALIGFIVGVITAQVVIRYPSENEMIGRIKRLRLEARFQQEADMSVMKDLENL